MYYLDVFRLNKLYFIFELISGEIHREIIEQRLQTQIKELALTETKRFVELESICVLGKQLVVCVGGVVLVIHEIFLRFMGPGGDFEDRKFLFQHSCSHSCLCAVWALRRYESSKYILCNALFAKIIDVFYINISV